jgi:hypothetical protein
MAMQEARPVPTGSTKVSVYVVMHDAATPFQPKAAFAFNTAGIALSYAKKRGARVAITPADLAAITTAWTSGGVKLVDDTNMPGLVRMDIPDAAFAPDGVSDEVVVCAKATGFEPTYLRIPLIDPIKKDVSLSGTTVKTNS